MIVRQFISDVLSMLNSDNLDSFISPRQIHSEAKSVIADFVKKSNTNQLFNMSDGWTEIPCLSLVEVPISTCGLDYKVCAKLMKSTEKLPEMFVSSQGNIFKFVSSDNLSKFINPTTPRKWMNIQNRQFRDKTQYYYFFIDGYFYIPIPKEEAIAIEEIRMEGYFQDKYDVYIFNNKSSGCQDCKQDKDLCESRLDFDLVCPYSLELSVKKEVYTNLVKLLKSIPSDSYPNLNSNDTINQRDLQNQKQGLA